METKRVLFCAESVYQLFNAITLRMTERAEFPCDIVLSTQTNWDGDMLKRLRTSNVFGQIYTPSVKALDDAFWAMELREKIAAVQDPRIYFGDQAIPSVYDELFLPIDHIFWKMLYRMEVYEGKKPEICLYDEGVRAYTMDIPSTDNKPYWVGDYMDAPFLDAITTYYLYQPELYSVPQYPYELKKIPNPAEYADVKETLIQIYGYEEMPAEPYIYLEDFFFADHFITNDFDLFKSVATYVGSENIITKRHPRDSHNRFEPWGFKTVGKSIVPWEMQLLANDLQKKVLISVSSTSILTPYIIFDSNMHVISMEKMFIGENPTHSDAAYRAFFEKLKQKINEKTVRFHTPASEEELKEVIRYIRLAQTMDKNSLNCII